MSKLLIIHLLFLAISCSQAQVKFDTKEFLTEARSITLEKFESYDLTPLNNVQRCILSKTILLDLEHLDDRKMTIINDSLIFKAFYEPYLQVHFNFIKDIFSHKYYFVSVPDFDSHLTDVSSLYKKVDKNKCTFVGERHFFKLNTALLDNLLLAPSFKVSDKEDFQRVQDVTRLVVHEVLKTYHYIEFGGDFLETMRNSLQDKYLTLREYKEIEGVVLNARESNEKLEIINFDFAGFLLIHYTFNKITSGPIQVRMYFVPNKERQYVSNGAVSEHWKTCKDNKLD